MYKLTDNCWEVSNGLHFDSAAEAATCEMIERLGNLTYLHRLDRKLIAEALLLDDVPTPLGNLYKFTKDLRSMLR